MDKNMSTRADALINIDNALQELSDTKPEEEITNLQRLMQAIVARVKGLASDNPIRDLFDQTISAQDRRFTAICLLRLLSIKDSCFHQDRDFRGKSYALFDEAFQNDIYPAFGIQTSQQTFEKERVLRDIVPSVESNMDNVIRSLSNLNVINAFRQEFMGTIGNKINKAILLPFMPMQLLSDVRLGELFNAVDRYCHIRTMGAPEALDAARDAQAIVEDFEKEALSFGTHYARRYLVILAQRLKELLEADLGKYASLPANIEVRASGKRYPFHEVGRRMQLGFVVKNQGPGCAFDVHIVASSSTDNIQIEQPSHYLVRMEPSSQDLSFPAKVAISEETALIELEVTWTNFDRPTPNSKLELFELAGQRTDLDWKAIELAHPYGLEPVETEEELVGREKIINQLLRQSRARSVGSSYIYGQKRVGKTSIAKTLRSHLLPNDYLVVYLEGGDYICAEPQATVNRLGQKLCQRICLADKRFAKLPIPEFQDGNLSPLIDYLEAVLSVAPEYRILFILDEFDELPVELYKRGPLADAFFLTLRSISGRPPFGFILVGGENMAFIMSCQGDVLNKFRAMRVDYFNLDDFQELVRRPVKSWFDITDEAIALLYEQTAGNPFYAKWICGVLFEIMVERRDSHITRTEAEEAVREVLKQIASNSFQHFWEDGIFETTGARVEEISIMRRKELLALASAIRNSQQAEAAKEIVLKQDILNQYSMGQIEECLRQFVNRRILVEKDDSYYCNVRFFQDWLVNAGAQEIMTTFVDLDEVLRRRQMEEETYVRPQEIVELISRWGIYKGQRITEDRVRVWLNQFGDNLNQRLMFKVLEKVDFYTSGRIREKLKEAHGIVTRGSGIIWHIEPGKRKRSDILVSYLDSPGKSGGGIYAKLYADENGIYAENVVERNKLAQVLKERTDLQALVFIDDFIGTGGSAKDYFVKLSGECGQSLMDSGLKIYFIAMCGFQDRKTEIEATLSQLELPINVHICDPLDDSAKCFSDNSIVFPDPIERGQARGIAYEHGAQIVRENYLGYGDCQTVVIFEYNCPNNNLPILWAESTDPPWYPLFKRT